MKGAIKFISIPFIGAAFLLLLFFMGLLVPMEPVPQPGPAAACPPDPAPPEPYEEGWCAQPIFDGQFTASYGFPDFFRVGYNWTTSSADITDKTINIPWDLQKTTLGAYGIGPCYSMSDHDSYSYFNIEWHTDWYPDGGWPKWGAPVNEPSIASGGTYQATYEWQDDDVCRNLPEYSWYAPNSNDTPGGSISRSATVNVVQVTMSPKKDYLMVGDQYTCSASVSPSVAGTYSWSTVSGSGICYVVNGQDLSTASGQMVTVKAAGPGNQSVSVKVTFTANADDIGHHAIVYDIDAITAIDVQILEPNAEYDDAVHRYNDQGIAKVDSGLTVSGAISPSGLTPHWELNGPGSLTNITSLTPGYTGPSSSGGGSFTLKVYDGETYTGVSDSVPFTIYDSNLDRDQENFKEDYRSDVFYMFSPRSGSSTISNTNQTGTTGQPYAFNCHESSSHAYNNSIVGQFDQSHPAYGWSTCSKSELDIGDVCHFTGGVDHSTTCVGGGSMWGANNPIEGIDHPWKTVDIDEWLNYKRNERHLTVYETYYKNPANE